MKETIKDHLKKYMIKIRIQNKYFLKIMKKILVKLR